jgi:hypothetical protein
MGGSSQEQSSLAFAAVKDHERTALLGSFKPDRAPPLDDDPAQPQEVDRSGPIGLALSGGGIRSATFSLGVLQSLARAKRLASFDYLSTVSGGGYIGAWLSAWIHRKGLQSVQDALAQRGPSSVSSVHNSEPEQVSWLRRYSNYLAPRVGIMSTDSVTLMAVWVRNLFLNLVVIVSFLIAVLLLPKALLPLVQLLRSHLRAMAEIATFFGLLLMPMGIAWNLSQAGNDPNEKRVWLLGVGGVFITVLLPGALAAVAGSICLLGSKQQIDTWVFIVLIVSLVCICGTIWLYRALFGRVKRNEVCSDLKQAPIFGAAAVGAAVAAVAILTAVRHLVPTENNPTFPISALILTVGPPVFLFGFGVAGSIYVGLVGRAYFERSREWWGRMNAWFFTLAIAWLLLCVSSLFVPALVDYGIASLPHWLSISAGAGWIGSLIAALAAPRKTQLSAPRQYNLMQLLSVAALIFIAGFVIAVSIGADRALLRAGDITPASTKSATTVSLVDLSVQNTRSSLKSAVSIKEEQVPNWKDTIDVHMQDLTGELTTPVTSLEIPVIYAGLGLSLAIFLLFGWRVDVNKFSMHNLYKNRLIRCYLGASNSEKRRAQPFTGFDDLDDPPLHKLATVGNRADGVAQRPLHIINTTLNISQGKNLAWQERKGASFVLTPRFCGFGLSQVQGDSTDTNLQRNARARTGLDASSAKENYRPTEFYARRGDEERGFTLGMAMATSGAAASPNMGPATRPSLAFILTLFNVRLGRWSPNTAGRRWESASPRFGSLHFLAELFGLSNEESPFVYLSDGGHFDNMGLYELVRRECTTIWVVDAAADPNRSFEDFGRAVRQCRVDLGVEISIDLSGMRAPTASNVPCAGYAEGKIRYAGDRTGRLVYIKPTLSGKKNEPADLLAYAATNRTFPQQSTANQFYDESEFESYRRLGQYIGDTCVEAHAGRLPINIPHPGPETDPPIEETSPPIWPLFFGLLKFTILGWALLWWLRTRWFPCTHGSWWSIYGRFSDVLAGEACLKPQLSSTDFWGVRFPYPNPDELWLWLDNIWVTVYSALFVVGVRWFVKDSPKYGRWFNLLVALAVVGGLCEYAENFMLLGGLKSLQPYSWTKFVLCAVNMPVLIGFAWVSRTELVKGFCEMCARYRRVLCGIHAKFFAPVDWPKDPV